MKTRGLVALFAAGALSLAACGDAAEELTDAAEDAAGEVTDAAEGAADAAGDAMDEAGDAMDEAGDAAGDAMDEAGDAMDEVVDGPGTIVDVAGEAGSFTTLLAAAEAAGLVDALNGEGPLTVFAPTDDAFVAALEALGLTADELLADTETLAGILTYHVVDGAVASGDLTDGMVAPTLNGADITVDLSDGVKINDATVTTADIEASNGLIHVIDAVLLPPAE